MGDMPAEEDGSCGGAWTDEKHTSYLNSMEASFVSCMLFGGQFSYVAAPAAPLPLDRCISDGADSTADRPAGKRGMRRTSSARPREGRRGFPEGLRRTRKRLQRPHAAPRCRDDQVVPEFDLMSKSGENASGVAPSAAADGQATVEKEKDDLPRFG